MHSIIVQTSTILQPFLLCILSLAIPVVITRVSNCLIRLLKVNDEKKRLEIEGMLRKALHDCASNALKFAMIKLKISTPTPEAITLALDYVHSMNPDTVAQLKVNNAVLKDIIVSKMPLDKNREG
ncbi:hypothetical protein B488_07720 [Liberibacter crescens BT-1]|uniref:Uncharacterized protein n=1 Tax=Liberibacter crescens (strain BT-1) TaxID=1215343 RepID=L0ET99_LIBCB|nr:hypothetical protein [Liberibacter crescens]AGA64764.1 hypothetical protein B488_07720 [Liberibacter crescens BT-1]